MTRDGTDELWFPRVVAQRPPNGADGLAQSAVGYDDVRPHALEDVAFVHRFAATLEFLRAIDYDFPTWADDYLTRMESALGDAYSEPVADVRGYIEYVRSQ